MTMEVSQAPRFTATAVPSVLQRPGAKPVPEPDRAPDCFSDLNLDQLIAAVTEGREQYDLRPAFHAPLLDAADVAYRYEVFRDLADVDLRDDVASFSRALTRFRDRNRGAEQIRNPLRSQRLRLDGASTYCSAVTSLAEALGRRAPASRGLRDVSAHLGAYVRSPGFEQLHDDVLRCERALDAVAYRLTILEDRVRVRRAAGQHDQVVSHISTLT
jgi:DNA mismatch repair protein MutS